MDADGTPLQNPVRDQGIMPKPNSPTSQAVAPVLVALLEYAGPATALGASYHA